MPIPVLDTTHGGIQKEQLLTSVPERLTPELERWAHGHHECPFW